MEVEIPVVAIGLVTAGGGDQLVPHPPRRDGCGRGRWGVLGGETEAISERFTYSLADAVPTLEPGVQSSVAALAISEREHGAGRP